MGKSKKGRVEEQGQDPQIMRELESARNALKCLGLWKEGMLDGCKTAEEVCVEFRRITEGKPETVQE